jgi:uncharacterized membrane protein YhhN
VKPIPISRTLAGTVIFTVLAVGLLLASPALAVSGSAAKMAASTGFLTTALAAGALRTPYGRLIFAALALCWWGDYFLTRSREIDFLLGLGAFLLGHLGFAGAFLLHGVNPRWSIAAGLATLPAALLVYAWLEAQLGSMMLPVCAYIAIISLMLALAIGTRGRNATPLILVGAALFYASDLFVARQKFSVHSPWNPLIGLPLYYAAQLCLALSITSLRPHRP